MIFAILDTSALISFLNQDDSNHKKANEISEFLVESEWTGIIPADVFTETVNVLVKKEGQNKAITTADYLLDSADYLIAETSEEIRIKALQRFANQSKSVSFIDCVVMATADNYKTKVIFGFDAFFRKNGYTLPSIEKSSV